MGEQSIFHYREAFRTLDKTVEFDGSADNGAIGSLSLFTVTGEVSTLVFAVCTENIAGATATIEVGTANDTDSIIANTLGTDIDSGELWFNANPSVDVEPLESIVQKLIVNGADIIGTIATAAISDGTIKFICLWRPLSSNGLVVVS